MFSISKTLATLAIACCAFLVPAHSQNLEVTSNTQELQQKGKGSLITFTGNVKAVYNKTLTLKAISLKVDKSGSNTVIYADGNPVIVIDKSRDLYIEGKNLVFFLEKKDIEISDGFVKFRGNTLNSSFLTYNLGTNNIVAKGTTNKQVKTTIINLNLKK